MEQFASNLLQALICIDRESTQAVGGRPAGLQAYRHPTKASKRWEESWSARIAELIENCCTEQRYPRSRNRCDVIARLNGNQTLWLEVKGAWRHYLWNGKCIKNQSFRKHLMHSSVRDVQKLLRLPNTVATHIGLLLVGFDRCDGDIELHVSQFIQRAGLDRTWAAWHRSWDDPHAPNFRTIIWLWMKSTA